MKTYSKNLLTITLLSATTFAACTKTDLSVNAGFDEPTVSKVSGNNVIVMNKINGDEIAFIENMFPRNYSKMFYVADYITSDHSSHMTASLTNTEFEATYDSVTIISSVNYGKVELYDQHIQSLYQLTGEPKARGAYFQNDPTVLRQTSNKLAFTGSEDVENGQVVLQVPQTLKTSLTSLNKQDVLKNGISLPYNSNIETDKLIIYISLIDAQGVQSAEVSFYANINSTANTLLISAEDLTSLSFQQATSIRFFILYDKKIGAVSANLKSDGGVDTIPAYFLSTQELIINF